MRQVFFLLVSAMIAAFSLSWASPGLGEHDFLVPDQVILPLVHSTLSKLEISSVVSLKDSCEKIESLTQEVRGSKVILGIKVMHLSDRVCLQQVQSDISVNFLLENVRMNSTRQVDVYFREDEENLKYFGSVELK
jgi:hypothetical protein